MANNIKLEDYQEIRALAKQLLADRDELDSIFKREDQNATRRHESIWNSKGSDKSQESYNKASGNYAVFCSLLEKACKEVLDTTASVEAQDAAAEAKTTKVTDNTKVIKID